jgi:hypothetical protein
VAQRKLRHFPFSRQTELSTALPLVVFVQQSAPTFGNWPTFQLQKWENLQFSAVN